MPVCKGCGEEADELRMVKVDGRPKKLCEECAELATEKQEVAEQSEAVVQGMMDFKGRR
jgi:ribosome-binding protein aMBF1 (putative translation factor)